VSGFTLQHEQLRLIIGVSVLIKAAALMNKKRQLLAFSSELNVLALTPL
jgi:hypothetical protein